jgi:hypothetical protein
MFHPENIKFKTTKEVLEHIIDQCLEQQYNEKITSAEQTVWIKLNMIVNTPIKEIEEVLNKYKEYYDLSEISLYTNPITFKMRVKKC